MCLAVVAWRSHPDYPLVVAANRDEFYTRRTRPAAWWGQSVSLLAGRDEEAGGTWFGPSQEEFSALSAGFLEMSKRIPVNVNELNRIGEAAGQLGIETRSILRFTDTIAKLGVTTNLASDQAAVALAVGTAFTQAATAQASELAATGGYVALGDSYSSGVGAGSYDSASGDCKRSTKAYPRLWAAAHSPSSFAFTACAGARTGDVTASQLGPLNSSTALVSITIGGNDAGFSSVITEFAQPWWSSDCNGAIDQAQAYIRNTLPGRLDLVLHFKVPDESLRRRLIERWHEDIRGGDIEVRVIDAAREVLEVGEDHGATLALEELRVGGGLLQDRAVRREVSEQRN